MRDKSSKKDINTLRKAQKMITGFSKIKYEGKLAILFSTTLKTRTRRRVRFLRSSEVMKILTATYFNEINLNRI